MKSQNIPLAVPETFLPPWLGPCKVLDVRDNTARLELPHTLGKRFSVVNFDKPRRFHVLDGSTNLNL